MASVDAPPWSVNHVGAQLSSHPKAELGKNLLPNSSVVDRVHFLAAT